MMRAAIVALGLAVGVQWYGIVTAPGLHYPDTVCPVKPAKIRYPEHLADYHDPSAKGTRADPKHYRLAYCKPTGKDWRR
jgi:hypothetical protein